MSDVIRLSRPDRGITHADFRRIFPRVVGDAVTLEGDLEAHVTWADGRSLAVRVSPEQFRRLARLKIPYVDIEFEFQGFSEDAVEVFMRRFEAAFQKGGG